MKTFRTLGLVALGALLAMVAQEMRPRPALAHTQQCADVPACVELNRWRNATMDVRTGDQPDLALAKRAYRFGKEGTAEVKATMMQGLKELCTAHENAGLIPVGTCSSAHKRGHWLESMTGEKEDVP